MSSKPGIPPQAAQPTPSPNRLEVTQLLDAAKEGDERASAELLPLVYGELRRLAEAQMRQEAGGGAGQTLQPTALVHEAYLRLVGPDPNAPGTWDNRGHFFGAAARAMRQILVERARARGRLKRGGDRGRVELSDQMGSGGLATEPPSTDLLALDDVLHKFEKVDKRKAEVVMLRYFAGLTVEQTATVLGVSPATVRNDWTFAKAWLMREIKSSQERALPEDGQ